MARARNIKPSFFTNDLLAEVPALGRLLFQGLWCHADREGRLHDRPRKIKAEILPYDDCDVEILLNALQSRGFILRYQIDGNRYIQVINFTKHQNPHVKESASEIPAPNKPGASPVQTPDKHSESTEAAGLIPDSLNLIPDSLNPPPPVAEAPPAKKPRPAAFDGQGWLTDRFVSPQVAADWLTLRRGKKALPTETAFRQVETEAAKAGMSLGDAVAMCCLRGWVGFKADWVQNAQAPPNGRRSTLTETRAATIAAMTRTTSHERPVSTAERDITGESTRVA